MSTKAKPALVPKLRFPEFREPEKWEIKPFQKLFSIGSGRDYKHLSSGNFPVYGSGGYMLSVNDFLYDGESACIGRKGTINNPMFLTGKFWTVDTLFYTHSFQQCLPRFVFSVFQNIDWLKHNEAGGIPSLSKTIIEKIQVAVPGLPEQQKISDCLSSLDELIAAQARKVDALKTHKKGLMQQLFPREGETQPSLRFPEFRNAGEWKEVALGQLMTIKGRIGYRGYTVEDIVEAGEGAISLSPSNISTAGTLSFEKATYISWAKFYESPEIILEKNFTVLVKTGSTYGKVAFIRDLPHQCTVNPQIVVLKPTSTNPYFLYLLISGEPIQSRIEATVVGGAIPTLSQESVSKFVVCVPSEAEQQRIADCLTSLDDLITAAIQDIETLKTHKIGLMQQLFPPIEAAI